MAHIAYHIKQLRRKQGAMTGICGLIGTEAGDLESKAEHILSLMRNRGSKSRIFSQRVPGGEKIVIGICDSTGSQIADQSVPLALDGVFFGDDAPSDKAVSPGPSRLVQTPGAFAFLAIIEDQLIAGRDIIGQKPLHFGQTREGVFAFASLRSPLLSIGITEPKPLPPGMAIRTTSRSLETISDHSLKQPEEAAIPELDAIRKLDELLTEAVKRVVPRGSGIAFSGGIDSALVAQAAENVGLEPELISVGLKGQPELSHAERTAKSIGLTIEIKELSNSEILDALPDVVNTVETTNPVIVGISVPIYFACQKAHEMGLSYIAAGQLSDELFGGYGKFEETALSNGHDKLRREMFDSVVAASAKDFDPGDKLAVSTGLELCCPFAYLPLVHYALTLPSSLRVNLTDGKVIRKYVLRRLASHMHLPEDVVDRPKKAVQYSSGVQKILLKEAKRNGVSLSQMLQSFTR